MYSGRKIGCGEMGWCLMKQEDIYEMLDSNNQLDIQQYGIDIGFMSKNIIDYILPMHPMYNKNIWENCAIILSRKTDGELEPYLMKIFEWIRDLTWPGAFIILKRLQELDYKVILPAYINVIENILATSPLDEEWLDHLSKMIENPNFASFLSKDMYEMLKSRYSLFWK